LASGIFHFFIPDLRKNTGSVPISLDRIMQGILVGFGPNGGCQRPDLGGGTQGQEGKKAERQEGMTQGTRHKAQISFKEEGKLGFHDNS